MMWSEPFSEQKKVKLALDFEINIHRKLLEGEESRLSMVRFLSSARINFMLRSRVKCDSLSCLFILKTFEG